MAQTTANLTHQFIAYAKLYAAKTRGDKASIILAQFINETGNGTSDLWLRFRNPFGVKDAINDHYQIPGAGEYAAYRSVADAFKDRVRIIAYYREKAAVENPNILDDVMALLSTYWCPDRASRYKDGKTYYTILQETIKALNLTQYDTEPYEPPYDEEVIPYDPGPERKWAPVGHQGKGSSLFGKLLVAVVVPLLVHQVTGGGSFLAGAARWFFDLIGDTEKERGEDPGDVKHKSVLDRLAPDEGPERSVWDFLIPLTVRALNSVLSKDWGQALAERDAKKISLFDIWLSR